ncbi:MAG: YceI family protein [Saprospiraceae bacterium]|nr:YceI family protein [Saprospiraceae bacterium]
MRCFGIFLLLFSTQWAYGQLLTLDHGKVEFHTKSIMSDIEAESTEMEARMDLDNGSVEIQIPIASFEFEYEMMQDHFNEDYLESEKYPNATFQGTIRKDIEVGSEPAEFELKGALTIHGVTQETTLVATLSKKENLTKVRCVFPVVFKDFGVDEPSILTKSVAKDVEVKALLYLK